MKKLHQQWMLDSGWHRQSIGGGEFAFTIELGEKTLISFTSLQGGSDHLIFYTQGGLTFNIFKDLAKALQPSVDNGLTRVVHMYRPVSYNTKKPSSAFIRDCTKKMVAWAKTQSLSDAIDDKCKLQNDEGTKLYHYSYVTHFSALILNQETDILMSHLKRVKDGDTEFFNFHEKSEGIEILTKAIALSKTNYLEEYIQKNGDPRVPASNHNPSNSALRRLISRFFGFSMH